MMMMLMMQQDPKSVRLPVPQGGPQPRGLLNPGDVQRVPVSQQGNMPVMISLQGPGAIPPSPDKPRVPLMVNPQLAGVARRMPFQDAAQGGPALTSEDGTSLQDGTSIEGGHQAGNGVPQLVGTPGPNQLLMKPGPSAIPQHQGASPQQQLQQQQTAPMSGSHSLHFPNVPTSSQTSRPKTPNRASPRPYYPHTPTNRPPSTEPSEINLSPERLNASIAGLFPPQINIPLPPRQPNLNRGFDQQGLNPTTLKAIGQAPINLGSHNNNGQQAFPQNTPGSSPVGKQHSTGGPAKRASPSNSRRASPASSRKTTPSPGRQNAKAAKLAINSSPSQPLVNPQNMLVNPLPVLPSPVGSTLPPSTLGQQHMQSPFPAGPVEMNKEGQMAQIEGRQVVQLPSDLPVPEIKSPHLPQEKKTASVEEFTRLDTPTHDKAQPVAQEESKAAPSPALREAPTSLGQLLDNSGAPNVSLKPVQEGLLEEELNRKETPSTFPRDQEPLRNPATTRSSDISVPDVKEPAPNPNPVQSVPTVLQRSTPSTSIPSNQITVFVASNPISSSTSTSKVPPTIVSSVVSAPPNSRPPQFITGPVIINPIFQVMKGSRPGQLPAATIPSSTSNVSKPVTVLGTLQVPPNIQFSQAPTTTQSSMINPSNTQPGHPLVVGPQPPNPVRSVNVFPQPQPTETPKESNPIEMAPAKPSPVEKPSSHSSPSSSSKPLGTPSSPGTSNSRRSPMSPTTAAAKATSKPDNSGQIHMTKPCRSVPEVHKPSAEIDTQPVVVSEGPQPLASPVNVQQALSDGKRPALPPPQSAPEKSPLVPAPSTGGPALTEPSSSVGCSPPTATAGIPTEGHPAPPVSESSLPVAHGDPVKEKVSLGSTELTPSTASIQQEPQQQEMPRVEKATGHEVATVTEQGCIKKRKMPVHVDPREAKNIPEKPKAPSRRSSRAERDVEEGSTPQEAAENGQRKRSARPGSASIAAARDTNTGASPNQAKRRKSK